MVEANLASTTTGDHSSAMDNAAELIGEKTVMMSLEGLSDVVDDSSNMLPSDEQTSQYLKKVAIMRKQNAEIQQLNLLDEIIELTVKGKIGQSELETEIPDSIVFTIREGDFMTEYIHASITKKWATNCFQEDKERYKITIWSSTLVEVVDKQTQTFDLFGLFIQYSATNKQNRISPEFITKGEPVAAKPHQIGNYSTFRGSHNIKRPLIALLPKLEPPPVPQPLHPVPQKVSKKLIFPLNIP